MKQEKPRWRTRTLAVALVAVLIGFNLLLFQPSVAGVGPIFTSTTDFDAGVKSGPIDGVLGVETSADNPGIAADQLELASTKGDAFSIDDADGDTFKWDIPSTCTQRSPTTLVREISGGVLRLGSEKPTGSSRVGVVSSTGFSGDLDVRVVLDKIATQADSEFSMSLLNEKRCYWNTNPRTPDGAQYTWDEAAAGGTFGLLAILISDSRETICGSVTTALSFDPIHLRITRSGSTWTWYYSPDGIAWTQDEQCTFAAAGSIYPSLMMKDEKAAVVTEFALNNFQVALGTPGPGAYRTSGDWTSPSFSISSGEAIGHVDVIGTFDATYALDRTEIRKAGVVLETFEVDNALTATPTRRICGSDLSVRLYLKGDGNGTPVVTELQVVTVAAGFSATAEAMFLGSSTGFGDQCGSDDVRDTKTEAVGGVSSIVPASSESILLGSETGNGPPSPSDTDASDDVSVNYTEGAQIADTNTAPDAQSIATGELDAGAFPGCLGSDDDDACTWSEGALLTETDFDPSAQSMFSGTQTLGAFPDSIASSDDSYIEYRETLSSGVTKSPVEPASGADLGDTLNDNTRTVWRNPRGLQRFYVVYETLATSDLVYRWSADGVSWSAALTVSTNTPNNFDLTIHDTGTDLKVFLLVIEGASIKYRRGSIADTADTIAWDPDVLVATASKILSAALTATIARTESGRLVIVYSSDVSSGSNFRTTRLIGSNHDGASPTWSGGVLWNDPTGSSNNGNKGQVIYTMAPFGPGFPDRFLLGAHVPDPVDSEHYKMVSAVPQWDGVAFTNTGQALMKERVDAADALSCVIDTTEVAHCLVEEASDLFSAHTTTPGEDDWKPLVLAVPPERESGRSTLAIDKTSSPNVLYAIYDKSLVNLNLFYLTSPVDAIVWSPENRIPYAEDISDLGAASRDMAGSIHIIGQRATDVLFYQEIVIAQTAIQHHLPTTETILKGSSATEDPGPLYKQGTLVRKTDGPGLQTVSGIGFQGKALILWWTRQSAVGTTAQLSSGIGFVSSSTQQYAIAWADNDNIAPSNSGRRSASKAIVILADGTPSLDGEASFVEFTADGWTLDWTTNPETAQATIVHFIVLGPAVSNAFVGQFTGPAAGVTGNRAYTGVGFRGDVALFLGSLQTALGDSSGGMMGFGVASGPLNRASISLAIPDGTTTADNEVVQDNRRALIMYNPALTEPTTDQLMDFVSFDPDGFTLNHLKATSGDIRFWAMVIQGGTYKADFLTKPTATGDQTVAGLGFRPEGVVFFGSASSVSFGSEDSGAEFILGAGSQAAGAIAESLTWSGANDHVTPTNANMHTGTDKILRDLSLSSQAVQNEAEYKSSDNDGFTITWTKVQSSSSQKWLWLAFGSPGSAATFPTCVAASDDVSCSYREADQGVGEFQVEVKYGWTGVPAAGTEWRLFVEGRRGSANPETIQVKVYAGDDIGLSSVVCSLLSTTDALYDCGPLTTDQLDAGSPDILFVDAVRSGDGSESTFDLDRVSIRRTFSTRGLEVRYDWTGIPLVGDTQELRVEGHRGDEDVLVQVLTPPSFWNTRLVIGGTTDTELSYALTPAEFNGGSPSMRFVDGLTPDGTVSWVRLDRVRIVGATSTSTLDVRWDWTGTITPIGTTLVVRASRTGDTEDILAEVWDWEDADWRSAFTIASSTETLYSVSLASACSPVVPDDCEVSTPTPGSVRLRFTDVGGPDPTETSVRVDVGIIRTEDTLVYGLDVQVEWALGFASALEELVVEGRVGDEAMDIQIWDWDAAEWTALGTFTSPTDTTMTHVLTDAEISSTLGVRIRFVGSVDATADPVASDLWIDFVAVAKHENGLDVVDEVTGISGTGEFVLRLEGRLASGGENFDVFVWDVDAASWTLWLDSAFTTADATFERTLLASEISAGSVLVRIVDDGVAGDTVASSLQLDLVDVIPAP